MYASAYYNRGVSYLKLQQHQNAIAQAAFTLINRKGLSKRYAQLFLFVKKTDNKDSQDTFRNKAPQKARNSLI